MNKSETDWIVNFFCPIETNLEETLFFKTAHSGSKHPQHLHILFFKSIQSWSIWFLTHGCGCGSWLDTVHFEANMPSVLLLHMLQARLSQRMFEFSLIHIKRAQVICITLELLPKHTHTHKHRTLTDYIHNLWPWTWLFFQCCATRFTHNTHMIIHSHSDTPTAVCRSLEHKIWQSVWETHGSNTNPKNGTNKGNYFQIKIGRRPLPGFVKH